MFKSTFQNSFQNPFPTEGAPSAQTYGEYLRDDAGSSEVFNLTDMDTPTIKAFINSNRDSTSTGLDLQNAAGPVAGTLAPYSDGVNDFSSLYSLNGLDGLNDIFDKNIGSLFLWAKASVWTSTGYILYFRYDNNNRIYIRTSTVGIEGYSRLGSVGGGFAPYNTTTSDWFSVGVNWNSGSKLYINGAQPVADISGGVWTNVPIISQTALGSFFGTSSALAFNGHLAYVAFKFGSIWSDADFLGMHNAAATSAPDLP